MSGGIITYPNAYILADEQSAAWAMPGNNMCWADDNNSCGQLWQITDLTRDATNTYIHTSLPPAAAFQPLGR